MALQPLGLTAQIELRDLTFTGGLSLEGYHGNFSAVSIPVVDSTDQASAAVGEFGARGTVLFLDRMKSRVELVVDAGLRQFAATGFELRDYAPREWASSLRLDWQQIVGDVGSLQVFTAYRGRAVHDRPPMPLFLQPGYTNWRGGAVFRLRPIEGVAFDGEIDLERANYDAVALLSQLDLLDRRSAGVRVGAVAGGSPQWVVRFYAGHRWSDHKQQASFNPEDPFRRDRTVTLGALWDLRSVERGITAKMGIEGTVNRSNSNRPEYEALTVTGELGSGLPWWDLAASPYSTLTWKSYAHEIDFARLVPGEEADNASVVYLHLIRPLASNLDGVLRFGWTRAETDIGDSYYSRFGTTFLLNFRPAG